MAKKKTKFLAGIISVLVGAVGSFCVATYFTLPSTDEVYVSEEVYYSSEDSEPSFADMSSFDADISIHFLELGNKYTGDCVFIQTDKADILIDCGSKTNSIPIVAEYLNNYCQDGILEYVIVTHAHQDHYAGFATNTKTDSIFDLFECEVIIDFAMTNQSPTATTYSNYQRELQDEVANGAQHFTALQCVEETGGATKNFSIGDGITMTILDSYYYTHSSSTENNYSVCVLITQEISNNETRNFLFTGDLEADGEEWLVEMNDFPQVELYKAGHHGSKTSSSEALMQVIQPEYVCVCCCAGSSEYTSTPENQFPTQEFIDRVAPYTQKIFVTTLCVDYKNNEFTSFNGNIVFMSNAEEYACFCSNNNTYLKDTEWFANNRTWPA